MNWGCIVWMMERHHLLGKVSVAELLPPEFVAVTVYVAELDITVGVPLITPVTVSN